MAWSKEMAAKDVEKVVVHYAIGGVLMAPGMPAAKGKDATRRSRKETFADPNVRLEFTTERTEIATSGNMAYSRCSYTATLSDPKDQETRQR